ncbi:MAG TPA: amidohydrolase family protein, partial [Streptosporangiaceae bacterium]|nr:amidohydrolase family protein [Streptosporangiaceae bacterium]
MTRRLFTGATVWAGPTCTPRPAWLLVEDDRVAALGETPQPPPADEVVELTGCHILPGFVDVPLHLSQAAWFPHGGDGMAWHSLAEALRAIRVAADAAPAAPWLLFWRIPRFAWPEGRLPTARELDEAAPGRRVLVSTLDMHRGALSPAGLVALGLADQRAGGFGGDVTRDRRGRPTGEIWEAAYGTALQRALADTATHHGEQGTAAVLAAEADRCLAYGLTHAHDPYVSPELHERMRALRDHQPAAAVLGDRVAGRDAQPATRPGRHPGRPVRRRRARGQDLRRRRRTRRLPATLPSHRRPVRRRVRGGVADACRRAAAGSGAAQGDLRPRHLHTPYLRYTD